MGFFWSENMAIFDRKQGIFGKGIKFDFLVAALYVKEFVPAWQGPSP